MRKFYAFLTCCLFFSFSNAQSITVVQPNGGEVLYACQTYLITWNATGTSNYYDIDYSLDGGTIWASIASNLNVTNGQYSWTVPNAESNTCRIRVRDKNDNSKVDISNANFTIHIPVVLTAPNGGEVWQAGSQHLITWNIQGTSLSFNLDYSTDNGSSWNSITTNYSSSTGSYNWTVPNNPSTQCLVRVRDAATSCMQDVSNNIFQITPAQPVLTYPNGGEQFQWNQTVTITWNSATFYSNVRLEYSTDNGATWTLITSGTFNDGSQSWVVPQNLGSTTCLIKASNSANVASNDVSNGVFSILRPSVTVLSPNGGENLLGCNTQVVSVKTQNNDYISSTYVYIDYTTNNGGTWNNISSFYSGSSTTNTINWVVPNGVSSSQCKVRAYSNDYSSMADTSNAAFTIQPSNAITVTAPNGGETIAALTSYNITWTNTASASGVYNVQYSADNGASWNTIASNITGNTYTWSNIPNNPSTTYLVRVQDYNNTCKNDVSNANFTVTPAQPVLTYPNGGEQFQWGQTVNITWDASTFYGSVRLEYSLDNGVTWTVITSSTFNDGSQSWTIPQVNSTTCLVKASNSANVNSNDRSNAVFSILKPKVTVLSPNGGESWKGCSQQTVSVKTDYTNYVSSSYVYVEYSTDNGSTWNAITSFYNGSSTTNNYTWTVPNGVSSSQCKVRAYSLDYPSMNDTSNASFTIQPDNAITVTKPNGGEVIPALGNYTITWTNTASASGQYNIQYSTDNGASWSTIVNNVSGNSYNWTVNTNSPSTTCLIRVQDASNTCKNDVSNATFTITPPQPVLTYPNGGEVFQWNQTVNITWDASTFYSSVRLEYSLDNGVTWTLITSGTFNDGSQSWNIPTGVNSTTCLVKASNSTDVNSNDKSNAVFSIMRPKVTVLSPNGGESLLGCNTQQVSIKTEANDYVSSTYVYVEYSTNAGSTWNSITSYYSGSSATNNINWTVPNGISSSQCLVRAYSSDYPSMNDTSNAFFTIQPNNVITVTAPNGGEVIPALSNYNITWTNTAGASGVYNVQYSSDNGGSWNTIASNITGNSYNWTNIPNVPTSTYLVRVQDYNNTCKNDVSNANFTVTPPTPVLTYPNGGEQFQWNQTITITWNASTFYGNVRLEYSLDNGVTWQLITSSTFNDGSQSWVIPTGVNSTTCLVKASNSADVNSNDRSDAVFSILRPKVTVLAPNGGESWKGCSQQQVSIKSDYNNYISSTYLYVEYSTDNGSTWNAITNFYSGSSTTYNYTWTVPNGVSSSQCKVRAYSTDYPSMNDTSNASFTIQPDNAITVTKPNGGEVIPALGNYTITWTNTASASGQYNIQYSTDNGASWSSIANNITGNSYNWTVNTNSPSTTCLIRVQDAANTCKNDVSNANFTITPPQPVLTYPNGGEQFQWGQTVTIVWNSSTFYSNVRLEYSLDNGVTWTVITSSTTNDGSQTWTVPQVSSTTCLIKASNTADLSSNDVSNAVFSILRPKVTVLAPNGGENWLGCSTQQVSIKSDYTNYVSSTYVYVEYSTNGGSTWNSITSFYNGSSTTNNYNWTVPNGISSSNCLVRAYSLDYPSMNDTSNAFFTIQPSNVITVTAPNGGEVIPALTNYTITWTNTPSASGLYNVQYSSDNGNSWTTVASSVSGNAYNWSGISNVPSTTYLVRVQDANNTCKYDVSDANFTVTPAQPVLTYPNGGEVLWSATTANITWTTSTFYSPVRLEYSLDNGATWQLIVNSTFNDGSYTWNVPAANSTTCLVKASNSGNVNSNDVSNTVFTIKPAVKILTPNGFDQLGACTQTSISFEHSPAYTDFYIEYSTDNGTNWSYITYQSFSGTTGTYNWTLPNNPTTQALVRVYPSGYSNYADKSDAVFTIKPSVTVVLPSYGGVLQTGSVYTLKWQSDGISNLYDIFYSTAGPTGPWTNIVTGYNTSTNTYNWTVPNTPSENCYIRIRDNVNNCKEDISNFAFAIRNTPAPITVVNPNTADSLNGCQSYTIKWTESGTPVGSYTIDLSTDGGSTWNNVVNNYTTTGGSYNWVVPNITTSQALIRVSSASVSTIYDISDVTFKIKARTITAKPDTIVCSGATVQLRATGGLGNFSWSPSTYITGSTTSANTTAAPTSSINYVVSSSNGTCVVRDTASITVQTVPAFTITADATNICGGQQTTFTAHVSSGGANPHFQWKLNNANVGSDDSVLVLNTLANNDLVKCALTFAPSCFAAITSNTLTITVNSKPNIGNDTTVTVGCASCTVNLNSLYNTSAYNYASWNTPNPAAAPPGIYRLVVSQLNGCTCPDSDTAYAIVNAYAASVARVCPGSNIILTSSVRGTTYQWQVNNGSGFTNVVSNTNYSGVNTVKLKISDIPSSFYGNQYRCFVNGSTYSSTDTLKIIAQWNGGINTDWENASNWGCGTVPDKYADVIIEAGRPNYPQVNCNRVCRSIFAATGTTVTVGANKILLLKGQ